jgi:hypothetical protein
MGRDLLFAQEIVLDTKGGWHSVLLRSGGANCKGVAHGAPMLFPRRVMRKIYNP